MVLQRRPYMKSGTWCLFCYKYKREQLCREIVAKYLGPPSENRRPDFLKIPEHPKGLELDIPYYEYGFVIEVQGEQHEKYIEFFHRGDPNNFIKQQARDQLKKELCEENWIALRYVWYYEDPYVVIPEHLRELGLID
ncbi:7952_t:CDS:1 [Funneliformis geosporum]|nr:7952_t:CDS:1 [Funneliformis geosporum]